MKPIALAQQIMLLHSWARDNNGRTGKLGSPMVLPAHVKGEFYILRNPEDNSLQSEQTKFQIESFGIGEVFTSGIFFAVRTLYDPNAYEDRTVRIIRLNCHKVKRGENHDYATLFSYHNFYAVRYSKTLYDAMFKARPSLACSVKLGCIFPTEPGAEILSMTPDHMVLNMSTLSKDEILSLHKDSFQCNLRV